MIRLRNYWCNWITSRNLKYFVDTEMKFSLENIIDTKMLKFKIPKCLQKFQLIIFFYNFRSFNRLRLHPARIQNFRVFCLLKVFHKLRSLSTDSQPPLKHLYENSTWASFIASSPKVFLKIVSAYKYSSFKQPLQYSHCACDSYTVHMYTQ